MSLIHLKSPCRLSAPCSISFERERVERVERNGEIVDVVLTDTVDPCSTEYVKDIPDRSLYSLRNLLDAGVPLERINVSGMFGYSDMSPYLQQRANSLIDNVKLSLSNSDTK